MTDILFITKRFVIEYLGIGYLSAALKAQGFTVDLLQIDADGDTDYLSEVVHDIRPKIICYSVWTGSQHFFYGVNRRLKLNYGFTSIFGGAHATFGTDDLLKRHGIDYVMKGEADYALPALCKAIIYGDNFKWDKLVSVKKPPQDLDALPLPDRELLYKYRHNRDNPIRSIMSSRGCPFACTFCFNSKFKEMFEGKRVRFRKISEVIQEAAQVKADYPNTRYFFFQDDELGCRDESIQELATHWPVDVGVPFHVQMRVEYIDDNRVRLLKQAGCNSLTFSIESADYGVRRDILGKKFRDEQIQDAIDALHMNDMPYRIVNMIGIPFCNTLEDMWGTYDLNKKLKPTLAWVSMFVPYPGTALGNRCIKNGIFDGDISKIPEAFFDETILNYPKKLKNQINRMQKIFSICVYLKLPKFLVEAMLKMSLDKIYKYIYVIFKEKRYKKLYDL